MRHKNLNKQKSKIDIEKTGCNFLEDKLGLHGAKNQPFSSSGSTGKWISRAELENAISPLFFVLFSSYLVSYVEGWYLFQVQ